VSDEIVSVVMEEATDRMGRVVVHARSEFASVRTGRASPVLVEKLVVDYHGAEVPLQQLAGFSVPEARQLLITPYDRSSLGAVEKAIQESNLGLTPSNDGATIRLSFPPLTQERRKELVRVVRQITTDDLARAEKELDALTRRHEQQVDEALAVKEKELLED
jgi:ribosome recycling factor